MNSGVQYVAKKIMSKPDGNQTRDVLDLIFSGDPPNLTGPDEIRSIIGVSQKRSSHLGNVLLQLLKEARQVDHDSIANESLAALPDDPTG